MSPLYFIFGPMVLAAVTALLGEKRGGTVRTVALVLFTAMLFYSLDLLVIAS